MSAVNLDPHQQMPLSPAAFALLLALREGEKHGYAILRAVHTQSGGAIQLLPGALYALIQRMLQDGWIEELAERPDPSLDDEPRRYYRLTGLGERAVSEESNRLARKTGMATQHSRLALLKDCL